MKHFTQKGNITKAGKIKDSMKTALQSGTLDLPRQFECARTQLERAIRRADTRPLLRDVSRDVSVTLKAGQLLISSKCVGDDWRTVFAQTVHCM